MIIILIADITSDSILKAREQIIKHRLTGFIVVTKSALPEIARRLSKPSEDWQLISTVDELTGLYRSYDWVYEKPSRVFGFKFLDTRDY